MKYDVPYISALFLINLFHTLNIFLLFLQVLTVIRRFYTLAEISYTLLTYISNAYRLYFYLISFMFIFSIISFIFIILRNPTDILLL